MTCGFNPEHLYLTEEFERAEAVVGAMCDIYLGDGRPNASEILAHLTLSDMLSARAVIERWNERPSGGGSKMIMCVPDDRLIAAIYTLVHYTYCAAADHSYVIVERETHATVYSLQVRSLPVRAKTLHPVAA